MANNQVAYGFVDLQTLFGQRVQSIDNGAEQVQTAIRATADAYNQSLTTLLAQFVERTTMFKERIDIVAGGSLQPLDQWGNPLPVRTLGYYDVSYPIQDAGTAWGNNRITAALMTVDEHNRQTLAALNADRDWMRRHILAALFTNTTWAWTDERFGSLTMQPLAIASDGVSYPLLGGTQTATSHTHYLAQAGAIADNANPFPTIYSELMEHPENQGAEVVVYVPSGLVATISALATFRPINDPNVQLADTVTRLTREINPAPGDQLLGYADRCYIVEWRALPANYMIAHARGTSPVLAMREYEAASLQGLFPEFHSPDGNRNEYRMLRSAGFAVRNRVGALAYRIGNASYAIPTGYTAPLVA